MTSSCPKRRRAKRTCALMAERTPCLRREGMISATSPNQQGVAGTDSEDIWMLTEESAILFISPSLWGTMLFFLIKEAYFYAGPLLVTSRCAIRGHNRELRPTL